MRKATETEAAYRMYDVTLVKDGACEKEGMKACSSVICVKDDLECPITDVILSDKNKEAGYTMLEK